MIVDWLVLAEGLLIHAQHVEAGRAERWPPG
jgi:hypothetical protein